MPISRGNAKVREKPVAPLYMAEVYVSQLTISVLVYSLCPPWVHAEPHSSTFSLYLHMYTYTHSTDPVATQSGIYSDFCYSPPPQVPPG